MNNVVLIGMPKSGKSTLGRILASSLGVQFFDTDSLIEAQEGKSIADIFSEFGEEYFRDIETQILRDILAQKSPTKDSFVLSVGGGLPCREENRELLKLIGTIIFIDRSLELLSLEFENDGKRPLLKDKGDFEKLFNERYEIYERTANVIVKNDTTKEVVLDEILMFLNMRGHSFDLLVIGDPIAHSLSPILHRKIFETLNIDGRYKSQKVKSEDLPRAIQYMREGNLKGINVTIPHKKAVIELIDKVEGDAKSAQAVNTIVKRGNELVGYNTDMDGLLCALKESGRFFKNSNVVIIGRGGGASAIAAKAQQENANNVTLINRKGTKIEHDFTLANAYPAELLRALSKCDILINATPLGMEGSRVNFADFTFLQSLNESALVYDLVYNPKETELLKAARAVNIEAENGLSMLIYQGIIADELFFDMKIDRKQLYENIKEHIGE